MQFHDPCTQECIRMMKSSAWSQLGLVSSALWSLSSVHLLSRVRLVATSWTRVLCDPSIPCQASLSITRSHWSLSYFRKFPVAFLLLFKKRIAIGPSFKVVAAQLLCHVLLFVTHGLQHARLPCPSPSPMQPIPVYLPGESHGQRSLWATVCRVTESQRWLNELSTHTVCIC